MKDEKQINYLDCVFVDYERKTSNLNGKNYIAITVMLNNRTITLFSKDCSMEEDLKIINKFENIKLGYTLTIYNEMLRVIPVSVQLIS